MYIYFNNSIIGGLRLDTGTHIVMGIALGGLATLDPVVADSNVMTNSVLIGTIVGSQIPDIDTVLKLKNNATYIRNHRGITHSLPAVLLWPLVIIAFIYFIFPTVNLFHLWIWTFLAVFLHVFVDIFNSYGTQALRPFSSKWIALGVINTFDPFIFSIHIVGLILWALGFHPGNTFLVIYIILAIYYIARSILKYNVFKTVKKMIPDATDIIIAPTLRFHRWRIAALSENNFYVGRADRKKVTIYDKFNRIPVPDSPILTTAKRDKNLSAFLSFSPVYRWELDSYDNYYEVRFIDLRYRSNGHYPFVAVVQLDFDLNIIASYTGWIFSEEKLQKKLKIIPNT